MNRPEKFMTRLLFGLALTAAFLSVSNSLAEMPASPFSTVIPHSNFAARPTCHVIVNRQERERQTGVVESVEETVWLGGIRVNTDRRNNVMQAPRRVLFNGGRAGNP
jgi:hypothetical protein